MPLTPDFRCSVASLDDSEPMAGSAPTETRWLFVEQPTGWEPKVALRRPDARVQLVRRPGGGASGEGAVVLWADLSGPRADVRRGVVDDVGAAADLDPDDLAPHDEPVLLVCTHGRRDVCCAEQGRPVAAALAEHWPEETWETTHLGGHRFAATLLALPSGIALGRLDAGTAVDACADLLAGHLPPPSLVRGRAGRPAVEQVAEALVRGARDLRGLTEVSTDEADGDVVTLSTPAGRERVRVERGPAVERRQSCADDRRKPAPTYRPTLL